MISGGFFNGLYIIPILAVLIIVHELGHFFAARRCGVKVEEFGIGIPPRLKGWTRNGVIWSLNWIPFGGFVRVKGEDGANTDSDSMNAKPPHQRAFFLAAGAGMNLLFAVVLMIGVVGVKGVSPRQRLHRPTSPPARRRPRPVGKAATGSSPSTASASRTAATSPGPRAPRPARRSPITLERRGNEVETTVVPRENPPEGQGRVGIRLADAVVREIFVEEVAPGSAAERAGLQPGDRLVSINERAANDEFILEHEITRYEGFAVPLVVERDGEQVPLTLEVPELSDDADLFATVGLLRLRNNPWYEDVSPLNWIPRGFEESYDTTVRMIRGIRELFSSRENLSQIGGPVMMGQLTSEIVGGVPIPFTTSPSSRSSSRSTSPSSICCRYRRSTAAV